MVSMKQVSLVGIHNEIIEYDGVKCEALGDKVIHLYKRINWKNVNYTENYVLDNYASATIEGACTTLKCVQRAVKNRTALNKSEKMVLNCISASKKIKLQHNDISNLIDTWNIVVNGVCENERCRGKRFRTGMVYIGSENKIIHIPQKHELIEDSMVELYKFIARNKSIIDAIVAHFYFVYIHPFCDGNGRTARILMNKIMYDNGIDMFKVPISNTIMNNINGYYRSIKKSETSNCNKLDITPFIMYMLQIIEDTLYVINSSSGGKISKTEVMIYNTIKKHSGAEITVKKCSNIMCISEATARKYLNKMTNDKTLKCKKRGNTRYYSIRSIRSIK